jgi:galactokinase
MRHSDTRLEHTPGGGRSVQAFAPGRVNLIGEHTDYNAGLCLPFAVQRGITVTATPLNNGDPVEVHAADLAQNDLFSLTAPDSVEGWRAYVRGATAELRREGIELRSCRLEISGDLPRGAGLSSSAALTVSACLALCAVAGATAPEPIRLAMLCSRVENEWAGTQTGLLDQLAVLCGKEGHALRIDFRPPGFAPWANTRKGTWPPGPAFP